MTQICISKFIIIGSDNGLSPIGRQAIIWTNAGILLIRSSGTNFSEILSEIITFSFKKVRLKVSSAKWRPFCLGLNVLMLNLLKANTPLWLEGYRVEILTIIKWHYFGFDNIWKYSSLRFMEHLSSYKSNCTREIPYERWQKWEKA